MGDQMHDLLQPDYTKSIAEVFATTTQYFILQNKSLDPICGWQTQGRRDLPSWIPDYSLGQTKAGVSIIGEYGKDGIFSASGCAEEGRYDVGTSPPQSWSTLPVTVLCLDSISIISPRCLEDAGFSAIEQIWSRTILDAAHIFCQEAKHLESSIIVVSRAVHSYRKYWELAQPIRLVTPPSSPVSDCTLAAKIIRHKELKFDIINNGNRDFVNMYIHFLLCGSITPTARVYDEDVEVITGLNVPEGPLTSDEDPVWLICEAFEKGMKNRVLAVTSKGSMCVLPEDAQKNDIVCVLHGCSVPVLLRKTPSPTSYMFVSACYMYGFMDGEAIAMHRNRTLVEEEMNLV
ncbi:hypothetical protein LLEC1_03550 [Akanthomyces lecanii]|uniref:Heterokaryon incompatibility domain-containing protein n=1 Tax=Cordyceps confragosa TaxID=2714763 RepID=A0A179I7K2_CORDF|nr:hypothetical protein LLEC1_03550 [Akanthomyces lecanii]